MTSRVYGLTELSPTSTSHDQRRLAACSFLRRHSCCTKWWKKSTPAKAKVDTNILACQVFSSLAARHGSSCVFFLSHPFIEGGFLGGFTSWTLLDPRNPGTSPTKLAYHSPFFRGPIFSCFPGDYGLEPRRPATSIFHALPRTKLIYLGLCHSMGSSRWGSQRSL